MGEMRSEPAQTGYARKLASLLRNVVPETEMKLVYTAGCVLIILGIIVAGLMQHHANLAGQFMARATAHHARARTDANLTRALAMEQARISDQYRAFSQLFAGLGAIAWVISLFGERRIRILIPVTLLIIYATTLLWMV